MLNQKTPENKTDRIMNDFFHSKTWKVMLGILLALIGTMVLVALCLTVLFASGRIPGFNAPAVDLSGQPDQSGGYDTSTPETNEWRWVSFEPYGLWAEIPGDWNYRVEETQPYPGSGYGNNKDECANITIGSTNGEMYVFLMMVCAPVGGQSIPCREESFLDVEHEIARVPGRIPTMLDNDKMVAYTEYSIGTYTDQETGSSTDNVKICMDVPLWLVGELEGDPMFILATYEEYGKEPGEITDFTIPDRIVLSLHR